MSLIRDENKYQEFLDDGFAILENIDNIIIEKCNKLLNKYHQNQNSNMYVSIYENSFEINNEISEELLDIFKNWFEKTFSKYQYVSGHFIVKYPNNSTEFRLHQDWVIVDKDVPFIHLWIPFQDTDEKNGGMFLIKRSHLFFNNYISGSLGIPFVNMSNELNKHLTRINLEKSNCLIYHPSIFHGSSQNNSIESRKAVLLTLTIKEANLCYFHQIERKIYKYHIEKKELLQNLKLLNSGATPTHYTKVELVDDNYSFNNKLIDEKSILSKILNNG